MKNLIFCTVGLTAIGKKDAIFSEEHLKIISELATLEKSYNNDDVDTFNSIENAIKILSEPYNNKLINEPWEIWDGDENHKDNWWLFPAETSSILRILQRLDLSLNETKIVFLVSDTFKAYVSAKIQTYILQQMGFKEDLIKIEVIKFFQMKNIQTFIDKGIPNLVQAIERYIDNNTYQLFNITGGYKNYIPLITHIASFYSKDMYYVFEESVSNGIDSLVKIPKIPTLNKLLGIEMMHSDIVRELLSSVKKVGYISKEVAIEESKRILLDYLPSNEDNLYEILEAYLSFIHDFLELRDGKVDLTMIGEVYLYLLNNEVEKVKIQSDRSINSDVHVKRKPDSIEIYKNLPKQSKYNRERPAFLINLSGHNIVERNEKLEEYQYIKYLIEIDNFDENNEQSKKDNIIKLPKFKNEWMEMLTIDFPQILMDNNKSFFDLLVCQKFFSVSRMLTDERIMQISLNESVNISLRTYIYRLYSFIALLNHGDEQNEKFKKQICNAFFKEYQRFIEFIEQTNFDRYILPEDIQSFISKITKKSIREINIDVTIDTIIELSIKSFKKVDIFYKNELHAIKQYTRKVIHSFNLPRYDLLGSCMKNFRFGIFNISLTQLINSVAPRLIAALIIGLVPFVLTGEIYEWYAQQYLIQKNSTFPIIALSIIFLFITFLYLRTEIRNIIGYDNNKVFKRLLYIFSLGVIYSTILTFLTAPFETYYIEKEISSLGLQPFTFANFRFYSAELELFRISAALLFAVILQMVWEDKPITQPL
ncbi:hypothetical protein EJF36_06590 [Bacillus sp. HMF5848]|uniref:hypothetical protein n=1 Tax=Bacillus sp. HMF5848 TaxID=2495421 RepID=UPI000F7B6322|nr:hypothetical protein [Bacillus sp. HMF5848]RSK26553.1 hypothetical protein EJF36_06590 [Bacillus sp. HMF5848]